MRINVGSILIKLWSSRLGHLIGICILLSFTGLLTSLHGQSLNISARFDTTTIRIGEQTRFTITIDQPAGMYVKFPEISDTLSADIEILHEGRADTIRTGAENLQITKTWRVTSFSRGQHTVQPLPFAFLAEGEERVLHARPGGLEVLAPDIDQETGIYDIKAPFAISFSAREILTWLLIAAALVMLAWYVYRYRWKKKKAGHSVYHSGIPSEPAHVIAMKELRKLKSEALWQNGMLKEYYTRLTDIIRKYIERRFGITAMERTSREIISELNGTGGLPGEVVELLDQCLSLADMVKFAKARPAEEQHEKSLNTGFRFVKATCEPERVNEGVAGQNDPGGREQIKDGANTGFPDRESVKK